MKRSLRESICKKKPYTIDFRIILPNDLIRTVHAQIELVCNQRDKVIEMSGTVQDITELKRIEDELRVLNKSLWSNGWQSGDRQRKHCVQMKVSIGCS